MEKNLRKKPSLMALKRINKINRILSQFCLDKAKKWQQRDLVFTFLTRVFNNIIRRFNWGLQKYTLSNNLTNLKNHDDQTHEILCDFNTIQQFKFISETVFMDWYHQYSYKNLIDLSVYFWETLLKDTPDPDNILLKWFRKIINEHHQIRENNMEYEDFYEDSDQRCHYSYQRIFDILKSMTTLEDTKCKRFRKIIKDEIEMILNEANDHNSLANHLLGVIFYKYREQTKKNQSLCFLHLLKGHEMGNNESTFTLGFLYYNGHCVSQSYQIALKLFKEAHKQGNHNSSLYLGDMYLKGLGVQQDLVLSYQYLFQGSFEGHEQCIQYLKENINSGTFNSYEVKYQQGDYTRCCYLGNMLFLGISVQKSTVRAIEYCFQGLEHYNCQHCFVQLKRYFEANQQIIPAFKSLARKKNPQYQQFWSNIKKYRLIDLELMED